MTKKNESNILFKPIKEIAEDTLKFIKKKQSERKIYERLVKDMSARRGEKSNLSGIPTGFMDIDIVTDGLPYGISVIGARPEDALTDFGLNIALNASRTHKVAYISPDIPSKILMKRLVSIASSVGMKDINNGLEYFSDTDFPKLTRAIGKFRDTKNLVLCDRRLDTYKFSEVCKYLREKEGTQFIVLDRFQSLFPKESMSESFYWKAKEISGTMHDLVSESGLALLILSEVKKKKGDEKLCTDHLRDFGVFEYEARPIIFLEKEGGRRSYSDDLEANSDGIPMKLNITNNLGGELNTDVNLLYLKPFGRFESAAKFSDEDLPS